MVIEMKVSIEAMMNDNLLLHLTKVVRCITKCNSNQSLLIIKPNKYLTNKTNNKILILFSEGTFYYDTNIYTKSN